jgi:hypothetical protein
VNTSWPAARSFGATRFQHQPPCHAPCTSTIGDFGFAPACANARRCTVIAAAAAAPPAHAVRKALRRMFMNRPSLKACESLECGDSSPLSDPSDCVDSPF